MWMNRSARGDVLMWIARVMVIILILLLAVFSLDVFKGQASFIQKILDLVIHLIPSLILIVLLICAWQRPWAGGFLFLFLSIAATLFYHTYRQLLLLLSLTLPLIIISVLFFGAALSARRSGKA